MEAAEREQGKLDVIDEGARGDVVWIDEMRELSLELPPAEAAIVKRLSAASRQDGGGEAILEGRVDQTSTINQMEAALRDEEHQVIGSGGQTDARDATYPWRFKQRLLIDAEGESAEEQAR